VIGIVLMAAGLALLAQTTVRLGMLSGQASLGGVMVLAPNGTITFATVGSGLALVQGAGGGYVLQAQSVNRVVGAKPARQADGTYLLQQMAVAASLRVYRNGVRQSAGDDYTYDAAARRITAVTGIPWSTDDLILVDFEF
jgi:hypothetical protein